MARVPFAQRSNMTPEGQAVWDDIENSRGGVARNYAALLNNPDAAKYMSVLGGYARYETPLNPRVKALAVLTAAREACGHYVWTVNQRAAKEANLSDEVISAIREYRAPVGLVQEDAVVVQFVLELSHIIVLSVAPLSVIPPPLAVVLVGVPTEPIVIFLSSTSNVVALGYAAVVVDNPCVLLIRNKLTPHNSYLETRVPTG